MARALISATGLLAEAASVFCRTSEPDTSIILTVVGLTASCTALLLGHPMRLLSDHMIGADLPDGPA